MHTNLTREQKAEARALYRSTQHLPRLDPERWTIRKLSDHFEVASSATMWRAINQTDDEVSPPVDWHAEQVIESVEDLTEPTAERLADALEDLAELNGRNG